MRVSDFFLVLAILCVSIYSINAQSNDQSFPTAITSNEISGRIAARDVGDARLTEYFYVFNATQGDVFINVVTRNLNGDIDVFTADRLRPLTKITVYADATDSETGRVIYLRQAAKLILRIEGRTPNDDAATFRIKFAGSFAPAEAVAEQEAPTVKSNQQTDIRVNSVGTIIEVKPKPTPAPKVEIAETKPEKTETSKAKTERPKKPTKPEKKSDDGETVTEEKTADESTIAETKVEPKVEKPVENKKPAVAKKEPKVKTETETKKAEKNKSPQPLPSAALENIRLVIVFKDQTKIEKPMSDVLKVGVDKGILTVITKDGTIGRYSILEVEKMTIE